MQYTLRNIPKSLDRALRDKARREGRSLNDVAVEAMAVAVGIVGELPRRRDLTAIAGSWVRDAKVERALAEQRRIDLDLWR